MKKCPFCAEEIQDLAVKCRYCGEFLSKGAGTPAPAPATAPPENDATGAQASAIVEIRNRTDLINSHLAKGAQNAALQEAQGLRRFLLSQAADQLPDRDERLRSLEDAIVKLQAAGAPAGPPAISVAVILGVFVLLAGIFLVAAAMGMNVLVNTDYGAVNNIGLMQDRQNLLLLGLGSVLTGVITIAAGELGRRRGS